METSLQNLKEIIETLSSFNSTPGQGITRFSYSEEDKKARAYLMGLCKNMGLTTRIDAVGNIFARLEGINPFLPPVMTGSHIDSVLNGGRFDGIVGVAGALEAVRTMVENGYKPTTPVEIVIFAEEEGSNFQVPVMGSKFLVGKLGVDDLKNSKSGTGASAYDIIKTAGYCPDYVKNDILKRGMVKAMLELHIEQSVRLDMEKHTIGIIQGIAGLYWFKVTINGVSNHAGATPMHLRNDPMAAAAQIIAKVKDVAKKASITAVATVGKIEVSPNIPNAIPAQVSFTVDMRDITQSGIDCMAEELKEISKAASEENGVSCKLEKIASSLPIQVPSYLIEIMKRNAEELGLDYILMPSGAVHDSNYMAEITDVGMLFVPSVNGRSHVPEEYTDYASIKAGADLLLAVILSLAF